MAAEQQVSVRFRHTAGDVGPFPFGRATLVSALKDALLDAWPSEGPLGSERPSSAAEIRLICGGKFLENNVALGSLHHVLGEPGSDTVVTMHVVVRPPQPQKQAAAPKQQPEPSKGCCCIQ